MKSLQCLRICRSCLSQATRASPSASAAEPVVRPHARAGSRFARRHPGALQRRFLSTGVGENEPFTPGSGSQSKTTAQQDDLEDGEVASQFRRQRLETLQRDRHSEDPVFKESYPRLEHRENPMSVPRFRRHHVDSSQTLDGNIVTVYGRVRAKRSHGARLFFLDVVNEGERLQGLLNFKKIAGNTPFITKNKFRMFQNLIEIGDHVSITGRPVRTIRGELTIEASTLPQLLSPALEQIPEKLEENRMQRRHVDLLVNPRAADILRLKSHITKFMRDFFHSRDYLEYQTPILAERAGGAIARPFTTRSSMISSRELMMRIAPELWLKRLVIGGVDKVFEIGPVFRNEGIDAGHNPEFTMCEFYSAYMNLGGLIDETESLMTGLADHCRSLIATTLTSLHASHIPQFVRPFKQVEFVPTLEAALGFRLPKLSGANALPELIAMLSLAKVTVPGEAPHTMHKLLDRLAALYVEPLSMTEPVFVTLYPACMAPLAKSFTCKRTLQLVSARTELFVNGREIANMYEEENNPAEQAKKLRAHRELVATDDGRGVEFNPYSPSMSETDKKAADAAAMAKDDMLVRKMQLERRIENGEDVEPLDQSYVRAMRTGLPPTGGWGCGVERLVMLFSGANRISDCFTFGTLTNVLGVSAGDRKVARKKGAGKARTEETGTEETGTDEVRTEETGTEEARTEETRTEETGTEEVRTEESSTEETSTEDAKTDEAKGPPEGNGSEVKALRRVG